MTTTYAERLKGFYDFMLERELIRQRRRAGLDKSMWTADPIFQTYSFTNVKREHDRTTVLLKQEFYDVYTDVDVETILLNAAIFRFFGTIESARQIGWTNMWEAGRERIMKIGPLLRFTPAYIVTSAGRSDAKFSVVCEFMDSINARKSEIMQAGTWQNMIDKMTECYGVGSFMAKEITLDVFLATGVTPEDWETWTPVGPGGRRGASRMRYNVPDKIPENEALEIIRTVYACRDEYWPEELRTDETPMQIWTLPRLDLTDIQFQFCEWDKYSRVAEGRRPKRFFRPTNDAVTVGGQDA